MFRHLFLHEIRLFRHHASWWGSLLVLGVLTVLAAWNGLSRTADREAMIGELRADSELVRETLRMQLEKFERAADAARPAAANAGAMGYSVLTTPVPLPSATLAPLAIGQSDLLAAHYRVTAHAPYTFMNETEITNPHNVLAGSFDVAFVMVFVLPIFIIALTYDLLSREKERGLLGLTLAHGVPLPRYTLAKCVARATILLLVTLAVTMLGFVIIGVDFASEEAVGDMALWSGIVILYALFWFALGLFVNALDRSSETNGVLMANVWLVAVVVLPALVNVLATSVFPAPSRVELTTELREAAAEAEERAADAREQYLFDHPELAGLEQDPSAFFREVFSSEKAIGATIEPLLKVFEDQAERRAEVVGALQYLSPAILAQQALSALAGTDDGRYRAFRRQVRSFHEGYQAFFASRLLADRIMTASDMDRIPEFAFEEPRAHARAVGGPALALALATLLLAIAALNKYRRYGVLQPA